MWLPILGLIIGLLLGSLLTFSIPIAYSSYLAIAVLAGMDSLLGGWRAVLENKFDGMILISGFFLNAVIAAFLAFFGDMVGLDLYLAAVIAFGIRIFSNIGAIRHGAILRHRRKKLEKAKQLAEREGADDDQ
ncbi:MAG: small basic family protein [Firmicutes bacterium]|nr:small basic family protein [Bacillota bacterium]